MSVIIISRGSFSGGRMLAERLAKDLDYRCVDREVIVEKAIAAGANPRELKDALNKPPGFWERFETRRYVYISLIKAVLAEEVRGGKVVYHGHAGHLLLNRGPILRVRVIAPLEFRISMVRERLKLGRDEAIAHIHKKDDERKKWTRYLYGVDWEQPSLYDVVVNLESLGVDDACAMLAAAARRPKWFEPDARSQGELEDFARASRVEANIATNPATAGLEVEVSCDGGEVQIAGNLSSADLIREVESVARRVAGVRSVKVQAAPGVSP